MKTLLKIGLALVLTVVVLGTLAVAGLLSWLGDQELIRVVIDGQAVELKTPGGWGLVGLLAAVAVALILLMTVVPVLVVIALILGLVGTVVGGVLALAPVLIVAALIWWLVQRSRGAA